MASAGFYVFQVLILCLKRIQKEPLKNLKQPRPLFSPSCQIFWNLSGDTVPLKVVQCSPEEEGCVVAGLPVAAPPAEPLSVHRKVLPHSQDGEGESLNKGTNSFQLPVASFRKLKEIHSSKSQYLNYWEKKFYIIFCRSERIVERRGKIKYERLWRGRGNSGGGGV